MIAIVGAGLAGLACARTLQRAGKKFLLLEAEAEPGGRMRTFRQAGFTLDLGFQIILDSYSEVRKHVDIPALQPRYFDSGALIWEEGKFFRLLNPLRHPSSSAAAIASEALTLGDKMTLARLATEVFLISDESFRRQIDQPGPGTTADFLESHHLSSAAVRRFFRPFFGGVFLEDKLETSSDLFRFYFKKFATGRAFVPAGGAGALPLQLASALPSTALRYQTRVESLEVVNDRVEALILADNERLPVEKVVLATAEPATAKLLGGGPQRGHKSVTVYLRSSTSLYPDKLLVLPTRENRHVQHFVQMTNIAPEHAPDGQHLVSATILKDISLDDADLVRAAIAEISEIFPGHSLEPVAVVRVPYSTVRTSGTGPQSPYANLLLAGDQVSSSSLEAVMRSGENVAFKVLAEG